MKFASSLLALYFLAGSFMPSSDWDELPKVFNLISHFHEHQKRDHQNLSFMEFISMHYHTGSDHKQEEDHSRLPFFHTIVSPFIAIMQLPVFQFLITEKSTEKIFFIPVLTPREHLNKLLQPPRA